MSFRKTILLAGGLAVALFCATAPATFANEEIEKNAKNADLWPAPGRDNQGTRHSTLSDISAANVGKMHMAWEQSTGALRGHEGQPVVVEHGGKTMMYFSSGCPNMAQCNILQALDLTDPDNPVQVWNYVKKTDRDESAVPRACCDTVHRGVNYADNKVIYHTLDGFVIALDASTGKEVWVVKHAYPEKGETITGPTLVSENLVIAGFGGYEFAARGRLTAYDIKTGKVVWTCHATGSDKDVCLTPETNKANPHFGTAGTDIGI
nr:PQQ-binding-like beta-propeller repeat protein [Hyphomicrobium sp.]